MPKRKRVSTQDVLSPDHIPDSTTDNTGHLDISGRPNDPAANSEKSGEDYVSMTSITPQNIAVGGKIIVARHYGRRAESDQVSLVFTHGAGGGIASPATHAFVTGFSSRAAGSALCFQGTMNLINRTKTFATVLDHGGINMKHAALGGRSMGARAAVSVALQRCKKAQPKLALILVSYPLAAGVVKKRGKTEASASPKGSHDRVQVLLDLPGHVDVLFIVGSKDSQCDLAALRDVMGSMKAKSWLIIVKGADHGMSMSPKCSTQDMRELTGASAAAWLESHDAYRRYGLLHWDVESGKVVDCGWTQDVDV